MKYKKPFEVVVGGVYTNGKGAERKVLGINSLRTGDRLEYLVIKGPRNVGTKREMTVNAFRIWSQRRVE